MDASPEGAAGIIVVSKPWARTERRCLEGSRHWVGWEVELSSKKWGRRAGLAELWTCLLSVA